MAARTLRTLIDSEHLLLTLDEGAGRVTLLRREAPFGSLEEAKRALGEVVEVSRPLPRAQLGLLMDLRRGPARNDPAFEGAILPLLTAVLSGFARAAVVVRSAAGKLQSRRMRSAAELTNAATFQSEEAALEFLRTGRIVEH